MKVPQTLLTRSFAAVLAFALCGICESATAFAQQAPQQTQQPIAGAPADQPPATTNAPTDQAASASQQPNAPTPNTQQPSTVQDVPPATTQQTAPPTGSTVDPSQGPLTPVPTQSTPDAPSAAQPPAAPPQTQPATGQPGTQQQQTQREPLGAAAAEGIRTAGGGASRPAGSAIAPAKQHQVRSFLIKLGAVAAAGAAIGTVYALSRGTSSTPPNTTASTAAATR
jgi:hypothetical protein